MIYESYYWKNELYKNYRLIVKFISPKYRKDKHFIDLEKAIMISAYIIRKLDDAAKIPSYILNNEINIKKYIANKKTIDIMNWQLIEENYKLENEFEYKDNWKYFINQIIHSFTFIPIFDDNNRFTGIMLNSDKTKNDTLFYICINEIIKLILEISEGELAYAKYSRNDISESWRNIYNDMKLIDGNYNYEPDFSLDEIMKNIEKEKFYKRNIFKRILKK
jgi:hypothetical protein